MKAATLTGTSGTTLPATSKWHPTPRTPLLQPGRHSVSGAILRRYPSQDHSHFVHDAYGFAGDVDLFRAVPHSPGCRCLQSVMPSVHPSVDVLPGGVRGTSWKHAYVGQPKKSGYPVHRWAFCQERLRLPQNRIQDLKNRPSKVAKKRHLEK